MLIEQTLLVEQTLLTKHWAKSRDACIREILANAIRVTYHGILWAHGVQHCCKIESICKKAHSNLEKSLAGVSFAMYRGLSISL